MIKDNREPKFNIGQTVLHTFGEHTELCIIKEVFKQETIKRRRLRQDSFNDKTTGEEYIDVNIGYSVWRNDGDTTVLIDEDTLKEIINEYAFNITRKK